MVYEHEHRTGGEQRAGCGFVGHPTRMAQYRLGDDQMWAEDEFKGTIRPLAVR